MLNCRDVWDGGVESYTSRAQALAFTHARDTETLLYAHTLGPHEVQTCTWCSDSPHSEAAIVPISHSQT